MVLCIVKGQVLTECSFKHQSYIHFIAENINSSFQHLQVILLHPHRMNYSQIAVCFCQGSRLMPTSLQLDDQYKQTIPCLFSNCFSFKDSHSDINSSHCLSFGTASNLQLHHKIQGFNSMSIYIIQSIITYEEIIIHVCET